MQQEVKAILTAEDRGYTSTMRNAMGVTESFGSKIKSGFGFGMLMRAGQLCFDTIGRAISTNLDGATKRFDTLNNFKNVMVNIGYGADEAGASIDKLADNIAHLPTTLDKIASQTQQFAPMTDTLEEATDVALAWSNAMAGGGQSVEQQNSAIEMWTKSMSKGKVEQEAWDSLVRTAPAQMTQVAKAMLGASASYGDLKKALDEGEVSIEDVNAMMITLTGTVDGAGSEIEVNGQKFTSFAKQAQDASAGIQMSMINVKASVQRNLANVMDGIDKKFESVGGIAGIFQSLTKPIDAVGSALVGVLDGSTTFAEAIDGLLATVGEKAKEFIPKGMEIIGNLLLGIGQQVPQMIQSGISMLLDFAQGLAQGFPQLLVKGIEAVTAWLEGMTQGDSQIGSKALQVILTFVGGIIKNLPKILLAGGKLILSLLKGITQTFAQIPSKVWALVQKIPQTIAKVDLKSVGKRVIDGLWTGIKNAFKSVITKISGLVNLLPKAVKKILGIHSPSRVFAKIGAYTGEGFALGIERSFRQVQSAMNGLYTLQPAGALGGTMSLSDDYAYNVSARYEVIVPVELNGREIARASASDMQTALNQREARANRKVGIR